MSKKQAEIDNPQAFPRTPATASQESWIEHDTAQDGMTLRDYFAAASIRTIEARIGQYSPEVIAHRCYELADAMLKAREASE